MGWFEETFGGDGQKVLLGIASASTSNRTPFFWYSPRDTDGIFGRAR
jgi:hypothetical protein